MKTLGTIQKLSKIGKVLSKIAFIMSLVGFCGCIAGLISLRFGSGSVLKIGGMTLHGILSENAGAAGKRTAAALSGWLIVCAGEAVLAKFAEGYFKEELRAGTPFTMPGAKALLRLGILTLAIPTGCALLGSVAEGVIAGVLNVEETAAMGLYFESGASIVLGMMLMLGALLCRYGAEAVQREDT